jgi:hypothetical protein
VKQGHPYFKTRFAVSTPRATIIEVTPELAAEMLATSVGNRNLRDYWVKWLAGSMTRGEMRVTSQGIGVDVNGNLRDGHHRLEACVSSGVPFTTVVVYGIPVDAYEVIDIGVKRTYADRLDMPKNISEIISLGCYYAIGERSPSVDQMRPYIQTRLTVIAQDLLSACVSNRRYYSSAPMKLAACITVMDGGDADFVFGQYRALVNFDINAMTQSSRALVRQVENDNVKAVNTEDTLARGLRVFDQSRSGISKIQINAAHASEARKYVASVLNRERLRLKGCAA